MSVSLESYTAEGAGVAPSVVPDCTLAAETTKNRAQYNRHK